MFKLLTLSIGLSALLSPITALKCLTGVESADPSMQQTAPEELTCMSASQCFTYNCGNGFSVFYGCAEPGPIDTCNAMGMGCDALGKSGKCAECYGDLCNTPKPPTTPAPVPVAAVPQTGQRQLNMERMELQNQNGRLDAVKKAAETYVLLQQINAPPNQEILKILGFNQ